MFKGNAIPYFMDHSCDWLLLAVVVVGVVVASVIVFELLAVDGLAVLLQVVVPVTATADKFC